MQVRQQRLHDTVHTMQHLLTNRGLWCRLSGESCRASSPSVLNWNLHTLHAAGHGNIGCQWVQPRSLLLQMHACVIDQPQPMHAAPSIS